MPDDSAKLTQICMSPFDGTSNASHAFHPGLSAFGRSHSETDSGSAFYGGRIAIGAIGFGARQIQGIQHAGGLLGGGRLNDHVAENISSLLAIIGCRDSDRRAQRHAPLISGQMHGCPTFGTINWAGTCQLAPF